jgi:hypothetical protein
LNIVNSWTIIQSNKLIIPKSSHPSFCIYSWSVVVLFSKSLTFVCLILGIVDFKIGSYSNCKYKSFVLNVIKSIKSIRATMFFFWAISAIHLSSCFFKEKQEGFSLLSGLGSNENAHKDTDNFLVT